MIFLELQVLCLSFNVHIFYTYTGIVAISTHCNSYSPARNRERLILRGTFEGLETCVLKIMRVCACVCVYRSSRPAFLADRMYNFSAGDYTTARAESQYPVDEEN